MKSQTLIDFFNERNSLLLSFLPKTNPKEIEKSIHKLRVEIKKIHFLFLFAEHFNHHAPVKSLYKPYRSVFKRTGAIRELQLLQQLIKQFFIAGELNKQLVKIGQKEKNLTKELISRIDKDLKGISKSGKNANVLFGKYPVLKEDEYLLSLSLTIQKKFNRIKAAELHASRKILKAVIYSKHLFPGAGVFRKFLNAPAADQLQDLIGAWHDKLMLLEWIDNNLKQDKYSAQIIEVKKAADADFKQIRQVSKSLLKS